MIDDYIVKKVKEWQQCKNIEELHDLIKTIYYDGFGDGFDEDSNNED